MNTKILAIAAFAALTCIGSANAQSKAPKIVNPDPHLTAALKALGPVKKNLQAAKPDPYGYRDKAMAGVDVAIDNLQRGLGR